VDDKRNIILAVLLTALIMFGWPYVANHFFPAANPPATKVVGGKTTPVAAPSVNPVVANSVAGSAAASRDRAVVLRETPRIPIETPRLVGSINLKGARIDDIVLPTYRETIAKNSPPIRLYSPAGSADA